MKGLGASSRIWEIAKDGPQEFLGPAAPRERLLSEPAFPEAFDVTGDVVFQGVHFRYPSRPDTLVLEDLKLSVPSKKVLAVVGSSGSGKLVRTA